MVSYLQRLHIRLSVKLLISSIAVTTLLLLISLAVVISLYAANSGIESFETLNSTTAASAKLNTGLTTSVGAIEQIQNETLAPISYRISYYSARKRLLAAQADLRTLAVGRYAAQWSALDAQINKLVNALDQVDETAQTNVAQARFDWANTVLDLSNATRAQANNFNSTVLSDIHRIRQDSQGLLFTISVVLVGLCLLAIAISVLFAFLNNGVFVQPLRSIRVALQRIATGDLTHELSANNNDELGDLIRTFNVTIGELRHLLAEMKTQTQDIENAALEVSAISQQQLQGSATQVQAMSTIAQLIEEMRSVAGVIDQNASEVAAAAQQALSSADVGMKSITNSINNLRGLQAQVVDISNNIGNLSSNMRQIGSILKLMDDLVEESQLLSLNATIEATGSSATGKRFSVVANQLGKLFERSRETTSEVQGIVLKVSRSMDASLQVVEHGLRAAQLGTSETQRTELATGEIVTAVTHAAELAHGILGSTKQQRITSQEVSGSIAMISEVAHANLSTSNQATLTANRLSEIANQLRTVAAGFVVS